MVILICKLWARDPSPECKQYSYTHCNLLSRVRRKTKDKECESRHHDAGENNIVEIVQSASSDVNNECHVWEWFRATSIVYLDNKLIENVNKH